MIKNRLIGVLIGALALVAFLWTTTADQLKKSKAKVKELTTVIESQTDSIHHYRSEVGQLVNQVDALIISQSTMRDIKSTIEGITSQFDGVKKNLSNVNTVLRLQGQAIKSFDMQAKDSIIALPDSTKQVLWAFKEFDEYFYLDGYVEPVAKRVFATPALVIDINGVEITKRKKFLGMRIGRKERKFELTTPNPYVNFNKITFIRKK